LADQAPPLAPTNPQRLLSEIEVERDFGISVALLRKWRRLKKPPRYVKLGRLVRYQALTIRLLIEESLVGGE
jgi:predicted DNA-binding transcriptional regulator AlpA